MVLVQARMQSVRLPGKALRPIAGKPLLLRVVQRIASARLVTGVVVTTSTGRADDIIEEACQGWAVECFRGPEDDVLERIYQATNHYGASEFVRISGDSPLIDPHLVDTAIRLHHCDAGTDLTTNVMPRTFPAGQSVEVLSSGVLDRLLSSTEAADREHVTRGIYRRSQDYSIVSFTSGMPWGSQRHVVDTPEDLTRIAQLLQASGGSLGSCGEVVSAMIAGDGTNGPFGFPAHER